MTIGDPGFDEFVEAYAKLCPKETEFDVSVGCWEFDPVAFYHRTRNEHLLRKSIITGQHDEH